MTDGLNSPTTDDLLAEASRRARAYIDALASRSVAPDDDAVAALDGLADPLPAGPDEAHAVLAELDRVGSPATVASAGPRYFGFVTGGTLPAALTANWLVAAWDQNGFSRISSPAAAAIEETALGWLVELLRLPEGTGGAFVTGATMANFTALAAARSAVLDRAGWDVETRGLIGAPPVTVITGDEAHPTLYKSLGLLGFGRETSIKVPVDDQGRMRADALPEIDGPTIICLQAGNVNSGAFDPAPEICARAADTGAWVHVDGAFGLWAAAAPGHAHLMAGFDQADSWACDAHKWLNVSYDSGIALVREPSWLNRAMAISASYLPQGDAREPFAFTPEASRRARGIEVWAALKSLGADGVAEMIARNCRQAQRFAEGLRDAGHEVLNDVVLNQVVVAFGDAEETARVIAGVQADGTCWCGGTRWRGRPAMRISVSSWATRDEDIEMSLAAILRIAGETT